jgi:hypothetical protein
MDVLAYAALNAQSTINKNINTKEELVATKSTDIATLQTTIAAGGPAVARWTTTVDPQLERCPALTNLWSAIPSLATTPAGGFQICGNTNCAGGTWTNGQCCQWTVPAGATVARIQLWGAGGGSGQSRCCGGSPFGSTGAYASAIFPVSQGWTYTICAGCAFFCECIWNGSGQTRNQGCPSWATGCGLVNFCADGGQGAIGNWMASYGKYIGYRISNITCNYAGACTCCCGSLYCFSNSCATCGEIPYIAGASYFGTYCNPSGSANNCCYNVWGIPGMWPKLCWDTNHYGYQIHPPIYGFESLTQCCFTWTSGTCCSRCCSACCGFLRYPGAGGWASIAMGGSYNVYGDNGKFGMACVSWF